MPGSKSASFPLFRILIAYIAGITAGINWFPARYEGLFLGIVIALGSLLALYLFLYQKTTFLKGWFVAPGLIYPLFIMLGVYLTLKADPRTNPCYFASRHAVQLVITAEEPGYIHGKNLRFRAHVLEAIDRQGKVRTAEGFLMMIIKDTTCIVPAGRRFLIPARYTPISAPSNPAAFDYQSFQAIHQVFHQCSLQREELYSLRGQDAANLTTFAFKIQAMGAGVIERTIHGQGASSFLSAMVTGQRSGLPAMLYQSFSRTGTVHIISISGMHVHIVFTLLGWLVYGFKRAPSLFMRIFRKGFLISLIWFYALISGLSPAVCRCALMIMLIVCTEHLDYKVAGPLMLSLSAFLMLLVQPWLLADMGFQLSYLAVAGLHTFQSPVKKLIYFNHPLLRAFWDLSSTSIAAQVFTFPVCLWYFHQFPVYFLFANLLIIPLTGLMLYLGIGLLVLAWFPWIKHIIGFLYEYMYRVMSWALNFFSGLPGSVVEGIYINLSCLILLSLLILSFHSWLAQRNRTNLYMMLMTAGLVLGQNLLSQVFTLYQQKIIFLSAPRQTGICLVQGIQAYLYEPGPLDRKSYEMIYKPALACLGVHSVVWVQGNLSQTNLNIHHSEICFHGWIIHLLNGPGTCRDYPGRQNRQYIFYTQNNYLPEAGELANEHPVQVISGNRNSASCILKTTALCTALKIPCRNLRLQGGLMITMN